MGVYPLPPPSSRWRGQFCSSCENSGPHPLASAGLCVGNKICKVRILRMLPGLVPEARVLRGFVCYFCSVHLFSAGEGVGHVFIHYFIRSIFDLQFWKEQWVKLDIVLIFCNGFLLMYLEWECWLSGYLSFYFKHQDRQAMQHHLQRNFRNEQWNLL